MQKEARELLRREEDSQAPRTFGKKLYVRKKPAEHASPTERFRVEVRSNRPCRPTPAFDSPIRCSKSGGQKQLGCHQKTGSTPFVTDLFKEYSDLFPVNLGCFLNFQ